MPENQSNRVDRALSQLYGQLSRRRRVQLVLVLVLMLVGAIAELVTLGAVLPFLALLTDPDRATAYPALQAAFGFFGWDNTKGLLVPVTVIFATAAAGAGAVRVLLAWASNKLAYAMGHDLAVEVYHRVLHQPYSYHVSHNTSEVIAATNKVQIVTATVLVPLMEAVTALCIASFILMALIFIDPIAATGAALIFGLFYFGVMMVTRGRLRVNSSVIARSHAQRVQAVQEGLGGIRDVLIDHAQPIYLGKFRKVDGAFRAAQATNMFIGAAPRFIIESGGIVLIAFLALYLVTRDAGLASALPVLGALALGAQRLLPLLQQLYRAWTQLRGNLDNLYDITDLLELAIPAEQLAQRPQPLPFASEIALRQVSFRYSSDRPEVLRNIELRIPKGARIGFIGRTGSGKTTLVDIIMSLLEPTSGILSIDGQPLDRSNRRGWQTRIAHVPQMIFLADNTIMENVAFGVSPEKIDLSLVEEVARLAQIADFIDTLPDGYATPVGERGIRLSGGQRQRIGIARALYKRADVLVFDEATSALDSGTEEAVMRAIAGLGRDLTILMIAHRLSTVEDCDQIVMLEAGEVIAQGTYGEVARLASCGEPDGSPPAMAGGQWIASGV